MAENTSGDKLIVKLEVFHPLNNALMTLVPHGKQQGGLNCFFTYKYIQINNTFLGQAVS